MQNELATSLPLPAMTLVQRKDVKYNKVVQSLKALLLYIRCQGGCLRMSFRGAMTLCIPEHIALQLKLNEIEKREVTTADDKSHIVPYVGPVQVKFEGRTCFTGALVIGNSVLMGAVPMEDMDLIISPSGQSVTVNPESPNIPSAVVK